MNTFGKILVVLNLVVALATLAFFVVTKARPVNWRERSEALEAQLKVSTQASAAKDPAMKDLLQERKNWQNDLRNAAQDLENLKKKHEGELATLRAEKLQQEILATTADINKKQFEEELTKMSVQVKAYQELLRVSESGKEKMRDAADKARRDTLILKEQNETHLKRLEQLAETIRQKDEAITRITASARGPGLGKLVRDPNEPNPPPVKVKGEITKVSPDRNDGAGLMVTVSVGADQGVIPNHTLDVYRLAPTPEYLGRLRILTTTERDCVGRLITRGAANVNLKAGDIVVDSIGN